MASRSQLTELGFSPEMVQRLVRIDRLQVVHRGVYALGRERIGPRGRQRAALLAGPSCSALSHTSAGAHRNICREGALVHISSPARSTRRLEGVRVHFPTSLAVQDLDLSADFPVTSLPRTLLDLATVLSPADLSKAIEEGEKLEIIDLRAIDELLDRLPRARGRCRLTAALADFHPVGDTRSPLEDRFADLQRDAGLPEPYRNVLVHGLLVDVWWPRARLVVELDSRTFHGHWSAAERDRKRDAELLRQGIATLRITHRRMSGDREGVVADIEARFREVAGAPASRVDPHQVGRQSLPVDFTSWQ